MTIHKTVKRPSHVKLMLANSCWQTQMVVCEMRKVGEKETSTICRQQFANMFYVVHTHQF